MRAGRGDSGFLWPGGEVGGVRVMRVELSGQRDGVHGMGRRRGEAARIVLER
jgi:hypothetical protein